MRKVSMGAGLSEGYLHGVLSDGKEMTIGRLMSICSQLNVTSTYILHGIELSADDEEILRELNANPDTLGAVRAVLNAVKGKG